MICHQVKVIAGAHAPKRETAFSVWDFRYYRSRVDTGLAQEQSQGVMLHTERYNYLHYTGLPAQLFD